MTHLTPSPSLRFYEASKCDDGRYPRYTTVLSSHQAIMIVIFNSLFLWCEILGYVSGTPTFTFDQRQRRSCVLRRVKLGSSVQAS